MPIKESSFRIGCGRYIQGECVLAQCGAEVLRLGHAPLIIGGKRALSLVQTQLEASVSAACTHYRIEEHLGTCNDERAKELAELAASESLDVIVGVGGGVIMDFAKLVAYYAALPVINVPTSSATCAAYTPLSVRYTKEGRTVGSLHYGYEVDAVISDTSVIVKQPPRLLLAGVFDALAKFVEIKQRFHGEGTEHPLGLDWAYTLAKQSYKELSEKTEVCLSDMQKGVVSRAVEETVFMTIAVTGVISGIARGSNQTALAHKFYELTRRLYHEQSRPYLHGEIVGIGLLLQNRFNGETEKNSELLDLMRKYSMPCRISDVNIECNEATFEKYYEGLKNSSALDRENVGECERLDLALKYLWERG